MGLFVLTGTPGTGKSTLADRLEREGFFILRINDIVSEFRLWSKKEKGSKVADLRGLKRKIMSLVRDNRGKNIVVEGHLACEFKLPADFCVVLRSDPRILMKRMAGRGYGTEKISENLQAELLDYCTQLSERNYSCPVYELDTSFSVSKSSKALLKIMALGQNRKKNRKKLEKHLPGRIDWSSRAKDRKLEGMLTR